MESLKEVSIREVKEDGKYLLHVIEYQRHGQSETYLRKGSGSEVTTYIKNYTGFDEEYDEDLFTWFEENNGDGDDLFSIFEL